MVNGSPGLGGLAMNIGFSAASYFRTNKVKLFFNFGLKYEATDKRKFSARRALPGRLLQTEAFSNGHCTLSAASSSSPTSGPILVIFAVYT